jgi:hypothetical protein
MREVDARPRRSLKTASPKLRPPAFLHLQRAARGGQREISFLGPSRREIQASRLRSSGVRHLEGQGEIDLSASPAVRDELLV